MVSSPQTFLSYFAPHLPCVFNLFDFFLVNVCSRLAKTLWYLVKDCTKLSVHSLYFPQQGPVLSWMLCEVM